MQSKHKYLYFSSSIPDFINFTYKENVNYYLYYNKEISVYFYIGETQYLNRAGRGIDFFHRNEEGLYNIKTIGN